MLFGASHGVAEASRLRPVIRGRCPHATVKRRRHTRSAAFSIESHIRPKGATIRNRLQTNVVSAAGG